MTSFYGDPIVLRSKRRSLWPWLAMAAVLFVLGYVLSPREPATPVSALAIFQCGQPVAFALAYSDGTIDAVPIDAPAEVIIQMLKLGAEIPRERRIRVDVSARECRPAVLQPLQ